MPLSIAKSYAWQLIRINPMSENSFQLKQDFVYAIAAPAGLVQGKAGFTARQTGLYYTTDGGSTWQSAYASLNLDAPLPTTCLVLAQDEAHHEFLFAGVPGHVMRSSDVRLTNGGMTWTAVPLPNSSTLPTCLAASPGFAKDGILLLGTNEDGVLRSADQGRSWASWNFGLVDFNILSLAISPDFDNDECVFAGTGSGLFISQTSGKSWKEIKIPVGYAAVLSLAISPTFARDGTLLVGTEGAGLWLTQDRGLSWQRLGEAFLHGMVNQIILPPQYPTRKEILILHENTVQRSNDNGNTWSVLLEGEIASLAASPDESTGQALLVGLVDGSVIKI
jgi:photosystem II stability/assembly factor-like uncharacterized protein